MPEVSSRRFPAGGGIQNPFSDFRRVPRKNPGRERPKPEKRPLNHGKDHSLFLLVSGIVVLWCFSKRNRGVTKRAVVSRSEKREGPECKTKDHKTTNPRTKRAEG
jgi:hypothetical protein